MLDEQGQFGLTGELLDLVEQLWCAYQEAHGSPQSAQERLLGLAYIVAVLRRDAEGIWTQLLAAPDLQGVDVAAALDETLGAPDEAQAQALKAELERRGWVRR